MYPGNRRGIIRIATRRLINRFIDANLLPRGRTVADDGQYVWTIVAVVGRVSLYPTDQSRRSIDGQFLEGACKVERTAQPDDRPCHGSTIDHALVVSGNALFIGFLDITTDCKLVSRSARRADTTEGDRVLGVAVMPRHITLPVVAGRSVARIAIEV